jgi:hypothetical protein
MNNTRIFLAFAIGSLTSCHCETIREGNFGLEQGNLSAAYDHTPLPSGFNMAFLSTIHEFFGREVLLQVEDIHPKDKNNILLKDLDLVVTYQINQTNAADFLIRTNDATQKDGTTILGMQRVERAARQVIGPSVRNFESIEILNDPNLLEEQFQKDLQTNLDTDYGAKFFSVIDVKVANILVSDVIESRIQSASVLAAEKAKNEATIAVLESRKNTLTQEAIVLKQAADTAGITVDQLLQAELIKAMREGAKVEVVVPIAK